MLDLSDKNRENSDFSGNETNKLHSPNSKKPSIRKAFSKYHQLN
jgi:hypothetical protein